MDPWGAKENDVKPARGVVREAGEWIQHRGREARGQIYLSSNSTKGAENT